MSLLFVDGFDTKDTPTKWLITGTGNTGSLSFSTTTRFGAGSAVSMPFSNSNSQIYTIMKSFTASSQIFIGAAIQHGRLSNLTYSPPYHVLLGDGGQTAHLYLLTTNSGSIQLYRGSGVRASANGGQWIPNGTMIASSAGGVMDSGWHYVEMSATIHPSAGSVVVKIDNTQVLTFAGNTQNGGTNLTIDSVAYSGMSATDFIVSLPIGSPVVDDLYICNSLGTVNNTFIGDVRVQTLLPTGAGASTQLTPTGSVNNWANAADVPDDTTTYNASSTIGQRDTYVMSDLAATTGQIFGVQSNLHASKPDAGAANIKAAYKSGATVYYDASRTIGTTNEAYQAVRETDPLTSSAWTTSTVNGLEFGAEVA